jgi:hypothetical protein
MSTFLKIENRGTSEFRDPVYFINVFYSLGDDISEHPPEEQFQI